MDIVSWFQLVLVCFLGAISPGPSLALVISNTVTGGRIHGVFTSLGHGFGIGCWALLTAVGIAEAMAASTTILATSRLLGGCILAYIGLRTMFAKNSLSFGHVDQRSVGSRIALRGAIEGFLVALLNPKVAIFFLAIFSHMVYSDILWVETSLMGLTAALIDTLWYLSVALLLTVTDLGRFLQKRENGIRKVTGGVLILISLYLLGVTIEGQL